MGNSYTKWSDYCKILQDKQQSRSRTAAAVLFYSRSVTNIRVHSWHNWMGSRFAYSEKTAEPGEKHEFTWHPRNHNFLSLRSTSISLSLSLPLFYRKESKLVQITLGLRLMAAVINRVTELMSKKLWRICHGVVGYVLIVLIIANIFEGINENLSLPSKKWNWCYGVILSAFSFVAFGLEVFRWIRFHEIDFLFFLKYTH